jgi:hypothetical protein
LKLKKFIERHCRSLAQKNGRKEVGGSDGGITGARKYDTILLLTSMLFTGSSSVLGEYNQHNNKPATLAITYMYFKTLYDLTVEKINLFYGPLPITYLLFSAGIGLLIFYKKTKDSKKLLVGLVFSFFSVVFLLVFLGGQFLGVRKAKRLIKSGHFSVVEGQPENYHPMPKEGHDKERFDINGVHFAYSDFVDNAPGYHNAASLGGVITARNYYRITYYTLHDDIDSNRILKIEIRQ